MISVTESAAQKAITLISNSETSTESDLGLADASCRWWLLRFPI